MYWMTYTVSRVSEDALKDDVFNETCLLVSLSFPPSKLYLLLWHSSHWTFPLRWNITLTCEFLHLLRWAHFTHTAPVFCDILSLHSLTLSCSHFDQTPTFHLPPQTLSDLVCARQHLCNIKTASVLLLLKPVLSEGKCCPGLSALTSLGTFHSYHFMLPAHQVFTTGTTCSALFNLIWSKADGMMNHSLG